MIRQVVLVGLSGSGKSTTARLAAESLGWGGTDLDAEIVATTGRSIPDIFRDDGEPAFREIEGNLFRIALSKQNHVIATGGGAVLDPAIWTADYLDRPDVLTVWLDADTDVLLTRLRHQAASEGAGASRPLLEGNAEATIARMRSERSEIYAKANVVLDVTLREPSSIASDIAELVELGSGIPTQLALRVETAESRIQVGSGGINNLANVIASRWPRARQIFVAVDQGAEPFLGSRLANFAEQVAIPIRTVVVPSGESSKSYQGLGELLDFFLGHGIERHDVVVALGGGVVGDLAGFAAATTLRGVGLVQVPTTLLSMVDSSVGGKTAINHTTGKNLIGAFYQPAEVVIDPELLESLPARECRSGWAEIIKHAVIEPSTPGKSPSSLLSILERNQIALRALQDPLTSWVIRRNVSLKAAVVAADEREAGIRAYLNFGHTIGHGIEAAGYSLLHGEAISVGISAALAISVEMDMIDLDFAERIRALLAGYGLPLTAAVDPDLVLQKMQSDKKKLSGTQQWVLPVREGGVVIRTDVPIDFVRLAVQMVTSPSISTIR